MMRNLLIVGAVLIAGVLIFGYANRGALVDRGIRDHLQRQPDMTFLRDRAHIRVLLCGTGTPEISTAKAQACTLVSAGGRMFLFDVGDGAVRSLVNSNVPIQHLERVFITHFHSDHFSDLPVLINTGWIWGRRSPLPVQGPVGLKQVMEGLDQAYALDEEFRSEHMPDLAARRAVARGNPVEIVFPDGTRSTRVYDQDGVTIDATLVVHDPVKPALGYILQFGGKKVFISGDTEVSPLNLPAMRNADLVVHEAYATHLVRRAIPMMKALGMSDQAEVAERTIPYHADTIALARQARVAGVKHLVLTHLTPYPDSVVARHLFTEGMREQFGGELTLGRDGMVLVL